MRCLILGLIATFLATPVFAESILIYDSYAATYCGGSQAARDAAARCGHTFTAHGAGSEAQWISDLSSGSWDIVVFDVNSNYTGAAVVPQEVLSDQLDAMYSWLLSHPDGCGIVALWFMGFESTHPIFAHMGVSFASDFQSTIPLYSWDLSDPVWAGLSNPLNNQEFCWGYDGAKVNVLSGAEALGGFTGSASPGEAGLVANNGRHTFYIGETGNGGTYDDDFDGILDWSELYCNLFNECGGGVIANEPSTWSAIKSLYR